MNDAGSLAEKPCHFPATAGLSALPGAPEDASRNGEASCLLFSDYTDCRPQQHYPSATGRLATAAPHDQMSGQTQEAYDCNIGR